MNIQTIYLFCGETNFPNHSSAKQKPSLGQWKLFITEKQPSFHIQYFHDFEVLKKEVIKNPLIPVLVHCEDVFGFDRFLSQKMLLLRRKHGVRLFFLNCNEDYKDGRFASVYCDSFEELNTCIEYIIKEQLHTKPVTSRNEFGLRFGFFDPLERWSNEPKREFIGIYGK